MFAGTFGAFGGGRDMNNADDEMRKSFLSDIKSFLGSISYKGGVASGGLSNANVALP